MSLNSNIRFSEIPNVEKQRSTFDRSCTHKTSMNSSDLVPLLWDEVLPGDTFTVDFSHLTRMTTPIAPVADNLVMDVFGFFVPTRLLWEHWAEFWGENKTTYWEQPTQYVTPKLDLSDSSGTNRVLPMSLLNYMGIPAGYGENYTGTHDLTALPLRGYVKIWNEWFRDENLQEPIVEYTGDSDTAAYPNANITYDETNYVTDIAAGRYCAKINKTHDYFTSCLPAPQKGPSVSLSGVGIAPVGTLPNSHDPIYKEGNPLKAIPMKFLATASGGTTALSASSTLAVKKTGDYGETNTTGVNPGSYSQEIYPTNLYTDLTNATLSTISELRTAFAIQRYYEACARGGTRYTEWLQNIFSVTSPDGRLQRPEFLGSRRFNINMDQVLQTSGTGTTGQATPQGNTAAFSCTANSDNLCTYSATEHGYFYILAAIRIASHSYCQGISKMWTRNSWEDYYIPQFANLSESSVYEYEIKADTINPGISTSATFGYQERWAEYRYKNNQVSGLMAPNVTGNLAIWNYCDNYTSTPQLSGTWIHEDPTNVQRTIAVQNQPQFIVDSYIEMKWTRVMPMYSVPGLLDHF